MAILKLLQVKIVFAQSHLFFPRIINWMLLIMFVVIVVVQGIPYLREVRAGRKQLPFVGGHFDYLRFFGTIGLTIAYFMLLDPVGDFFPNTGLGFLLMSIPYMLLLSWLYLYQRNRRHLLLAAVHAVLAPLIAWYVLGQLFNVTLP